MKWSEISGKVKNGKVCQGREFFGNFRSQSKTACSMGWTRSVEKPKWPPPTNPFRRAWAQSIFGREKKSKKPLNQRDGLKDATTNTMCAKSVWFVHLFDFSNVGLWTMEKERIRFWWKRNFLLLLLLLSKSVTHSFAWPGRQNVVPTWTRSIAKYRSSSKDHHHQIPSLWSMRRRRSECGRWKEKTC